MQGYKSIFTSKVFWGAVVTVLSSLFPKVIHVSDADATVSTILTVIGGVFTVYGRWAATSKVSITGEAPVPSPFVRP